MNSAYGILPNATSDRILEGFIEGGVGVALVFVQYQVEGSSPGPAMAFRPILESISPEVPKFRSAICDLEPVVANKEEIVTALL